MAQAYEEEVSQESQGQSLELMGSQVGKKPILNYQFSFNL